MDWGGNHTQLFCAMDGGEPLAYAAVQYGDKEESALVREYAGDRDALLRALPALGAMLSKARVRCTAPLRDPLLAKAARMGLPAELCPWMGTVKILDCEAFMRALRPYFSQYLPREQAEGLRLSRGESGYRLEMGEDSIAFQDGASLHGWLFGASAQRSGASSRLGRACQRVFPLPLAWLDNLNSQ